MSFLSSILSSIGGAEGGPSKPSTSALQPTTSRDANGSNAKTAPQMPSKSGPPGSSVAGEPPKISLTTGSLAVTSRGPDLKRKAESAISSPAKKLSRVESPSTASNTAILPSHHKQLANAVTVARTISRPSTPVAGNRTGVRPGLTSRVSTDATAQKSVTTQLPSTGQSSTTGQPIASSTGPTKPPPKGSYREIMARAQAAKATQAEFGQIKHKPVQKLSKKERAAQEALAAAGTPRNKAAGRQGIQNNARKREDLSSTTSRAGTNSNTQIPEKKKVPVDLGYKGTMRPNPQQSTYTGTSKPKAPLPSKSSLQATRGMNQSKGPVSSDRDKRYTYASYSDEDDEEDEEEEDYDDESDMEAAGFDELMDEEEQSLKYAKKEDEEALKLEHALRKEKMERRQKLEKLAASRRK